MSSSNSGAFGDGSYNTAKVFAEKALNDILGGITNLSGIIEARYAQAIENVLNKSRGGDVIPSLAQMMDQSGNMIKFSSIFQLLVAQMQTLSRVAQAITSRAGS